MSATLDILFVADARFEGGTSTALAVEIRAAARAGLRTGLLAIKGPLLGLPFPMHPDLRKLIDDGLTERIDPDMRLTARLTLIHHPTIVENRPTRRLSITTDKLLIVLHHPMYDGNGRRQYDLDRVIAHASDAFGADVHLAPVSAVVRDSLPRLLPPYAHMLEEDWGNLIELDDWPAKLVRLPAYPVVIGRHSRPDPLKWPTAKDARLAYPADGSRFRVRALGADAYLAEKYGTLPTNWELIPFAWDGVPDFLGTLDFYVYFHDPAWSEAFGRTILEALATGLVVILPPHFAVLFAKAAVYAEPAEVESVIARFVADPALYRSQCEQARRFVENNYDAAIYSDRVARIMGDETTLPAADALFPPLPQRNVLFASSNGIGVGHLTQQLAIAQRVPPDLTPVFATMSYSMKAAVQHGYQAHFLPHHRILEADPEDWNTCLAEELFELVAHLRPAVFAYDATAVFEGVTRALDMFPDIFKIWVRRPLWQESHRVFLEFSDSFDAVIEPGELAETFDHGPTAACRKEVFLVPPVLHLDPSERMSRESARAALGIPDGMTVVAFQLGAGANFDVKDLRAALLAEVLRRPDTIALEIQSPIKPNATGLEILGERHRTVELFPSFRFSRAFDAAISAAGYNTFHEQVLGSIPTLFVPNEGDEMDLQANRARWAELTGRGWMMRRDYDLGFAAQHVERLLDPVERAAVIRRCQSIVWKNGAVDIARYVEDHARMLRTDWDITKLGST
ncbi:glycosyltransferase [Shinella sp.]|uniref:glycosyltransferase n=1 Tax=Shinella sp. TaxID=1870904 RepID=UPI003F70E251